MRKTEAVLVAVFIVGIILRLLNIPGGVILTTIAGLSLLVIYHLLGFAFFNGIELMKIFKADSYSGTRWYHIVIGIISGLAIGCGIITVLFAIMQWPGARVLLSASLPPLVLVSVAAAALSATGHSSAKRILIRSVPLLAAIVYLVVLHSK